MSEIGIFFIAITTLFGSWWGSVFSPSAITVSQNQMSTSTVLYTQKPGSAERTQDPNWERVLASGPTSVGYYVSNGGVYYNEGSDSKKVSADQDSFVVSTSNVSLAKDKDIVYFAGESIVDADSATAVLVQGTKWFDYLKDKGHVWILNDEGAKLIPDMDANSFTFVGWATDGPGLTFYIKDKNHVSLSGTYTIPNADPGTFVVSSCFGEDHCPFDAQDKDHKYIGGKVVR